MPKLLTPEEFAQVVDQEIGKLPRNVIKVYLPSVKKMKDAGAKWKDIATLLTEKAGLPIKTSALKTAYFESFPDEKKERKPKDEKQEKPRREVKIG